MGIRLLDIHQSVTMNPDPAQVGATSQRSESPARNVTGLVYQIETGDPTLPYEVPND